MTSIVRQKSTPTSTIKAVGVILAVVLQLGPEFSILATKFLNDVRAWWLLCEDGFALLYEDDTHLLLE